MRPPAEEDEEPRPDEELDVEPEDEDPVLPVEKDDELPPLLEELELPDVLPPLDDDELPPLLPLPPPPLRLKRSEKDVEGSSRGACAGCANDVRDVVSGMAIAEAVASSRATPVRIKFNFMLLALMWVAVVDGNDV